MKGSLHYKPVKPKVKVYSTEHYTYTDSLIYTAKVLQDSTFAIELNFKFSSKITLQVDDQYYEMFVAPNANYAVQLIKFQGEESKSLSKRKYAHLRILQDGENQINTKLDSFNLEVDQIITNNAQYFIRKQAKPVVEEFKSKYKEIIQGEENPYIKNYYQYVLGQLELTTNYSRTQLMKGYIESFDLDYKHPEVLKFLGDFFGNYRRFYGVNRLKLKLASSVNVHENPDSLLAVLKTNQYLKSCSKDQLDFVLINELNSMLYDKNFKRKSVYQTMLNLQPNNTDLLSIKSNLIKAWEKKISFFKAPNFKIITIDGQEVQLTDLRGKYVYIDFWATWCSPCLKEMELTNELYSKYKKQIEVVSVSIDQSERKFKRFMTRNEYPWIFGRADDIEGLKNMYEVQLIPRYVLINPEGEVIRYNALRPSSGIEKEFWNIKQKAKPKRKDKEIWEMK